MYEVKRPGKDKKLHVRGAKGRKDRYTMLSEKALEVLREYLEEYRPQNWLFSGQDKERHITPELLKRYFQMLVKVLEYFNGNGLGPKSSG